MEIIIFINIFYKRGSIISESVTVCYAFFVVGRSLLCVSITSVYAFLLTVVICIACRSRSVMLFFAVGHGLWCLSVTVCDACRSRSVMPISHGLRFVMDMVCGRRRTRCTVLPENRSDLEPIGPDLGSSEFRLTSGPKEYCRAGIQHLH